MVISQNNITEHEGLPAPKFFSTFKIFGMEEAFLQNIYILKQDLPYNHYLDTRCGAGGG